jgi:hypothetical protein
VTFSYESSEIRFLRIFCYAKTLRARSLACNKAVQTAVFHTANTGLRRGTALPAIQRAGPNSADCWLADCLGRLHARISRRPQCAATVTTCTNSCAGSIRPKDPPRGSKSCRPSISSIIASTCSRSRACGPPLARVRPLPRSGRFEQAKMRHRYHRHQGVSIGT